MEQGGIHVATVGPRAHAETRPGQHRRPRRAEEARAERARRRAAAGGVMLPGRYKRVRIKQQQGVRFEEFDFSYYNRTPFTGLENDLANCYTNALLQASHHGYRPCRRLLAPRAAPTPRRCALPGTTAG